MKRIAKKSGRTPERETLTEAYEVRAFRDESEEQKAAVEAVPEIAHAAPGAFERIKKHPHGHGDQRVIPDDCQFGDNDQCSVDA